MFHILALIATYSNLYGLDPGLVAAIVEVESGFDSTKVGTIGEIGLMQIRPSSVDISASELFNIEQNIASGTGYLATVKKLCKHKKKDTYVVCYNHGPTGGSRLLHPTKDGYYRKVMNAKTKWSRYFVYSPFNP